VLPAVHWQIRQRHSPNHLTRSRSARAIATTCLRICGIKSSTESPMCLYGVCVTITRALVMLLALLTRWLSALAQRPAIGWLAWRSAVGDIVYNDHKTGIPSWRRNSIDVVASRFQAQKLNQPYASMAASNETLIVGVWDDHGIHHHHYHYQRRACR
jgi:hypothetical protein